MAIDIENRFFYGTSLGYPEDRTRERLIEMNDLGMSETGYGSFGIKGVMSGLYIEKVWGYDAEAWKGYMDWVREMINTKK